MTPKRWPSVSAVRIPHSAMPKTGFAVASRAENRPGSLKQAMTKAVARASLSRIRRQSGRITLSASVWLSTAGGPAQRVTQSIPGPPAKRKASIASSMPRVTASVELGLITRIRSAISLFLRWAPYRDYPNSVRRRTLSLPPRPARGGDRMIKNFSAAAFFGGLLAAMFAAQPALAQKSGGILRLSHFDSPASMSILEEATRAAEEPAMAVMNNLVVYDQHVAQNSLQSIVPDLATKWEWSEDGKPFTAKDVKCTWDLLMGTGSESLRINPRKSWYSNVSEITTSGDYEVTFHLNRPQPALLALLAAGWAPIYPCHVSPREMRSHPIGTGPFKFIEF